MRINVDEYVMGMSIDLERMKKFAKDNPEEAKRLSTESLIRTGVLNDDGTPKEHIIEYSHIGI